MTPSEVRLLPRESPAYNSAMNPGFAQEVARIGRLARRWAALRAVLRGAGVGLAVWLLLGAVDYSLRTADGGLRWLTSGVAWAALAAALWRFVWKAWPARLDAVAAARRLEDCFPELRDRLASACEFAARPGESAWGSGELRRAAVEEAGRLAAKFDLGRALDVGPVRRSGAALAAVVLSATLLTICDFPSARRALVRLAAPWANEEWPSENRLFWIGLPHRAAAGGELEVAVGDASGRPPGAVDLWIWREGDPEERIERASMRRRDDRFVYRIDRLSRSVWLRAAGGDDRSMAWAAVEVVEPPALARLEVRLVPPDYTGRPSELAGQPLRALAGSRVEIGGAATSVLSGVRIRSADGEEGVVAKGRLRSGGREFTFSAHPDEAWMLRRSGAFVLELIDETGMRGEGRRFAVQVLPDEPPTIAWELPEPDAAATAGAKLPVRLVAKDDLAVRRVGLRYRRLDRSASSEAGGVEGKPNDPENGSGGRAESTERSDSESDEDARGAKSSEASDRPEGAGERGTSESGESGEGGESGEAGESDSVDGRLELYEGPERAAPPGEMMGDLPGESRPIDARWDLARLPGLRAGDTIELWIAAEDYLGQVVESPVRRLQIIADSEFEERQGRRETHLLQRLEEALRLQREVRSQTTAVATALRETGRIESSQADRLQAAELQQRQVLRALGADRDGVVGLIDLMLAELADNRVDNSGLVRRLTDLRRELNLLARDHLPFISPSLVAVRKSAQGEAGRTAADGGDAARERARTDEWSTQLAQADRHAEAVVTRLERLLGELAPWDELRRLQRDFGKLVREQRDLQRQTAELLKESDGALDRGTRRGAERMQAAERQYELERRFARLVEQVAEQEGRAREAGPPESRSTLEAALQTAERSEAGPKMREAGQTLSENRVGRAVRLQGEAIEALESFTAALAGREPATAPPALAGAERAIVELLAAQEAVRPTFAKMADERPDPASPETDAQRRRRDELTAVELELARRTLGVAEQAGDEQAVALTLDGVARETERLVEGLQRDERPADLLERLDGVVRRLRALVESLQADRPGERAGGEGPEDPSDPAEGPRQERALADLKLLQSLQRELERRTGELAQRRAREGATTPELARELMELAKQQARLADLVGKLLSGP